MNYSYKSMTMLIGLEVNVAGKPYEPRLIGDYQFDEVASALQKSIRRSQEYEASFWAYVIHQSGYGLYLWRRLIVINSEDIGNGDPQASIILASLRTNWEFLHKHTKEMTLSKCFLAIQAVLYLCRSSKVREVDSLTNLIHERFEKDERITVPDEAIDPHTNQGKKLYGRFGAKDGKEKDRWDRWFEESSQITNPTYKDKWESDFKKLIYDRIK